jgi:hypothetical protein
MITKEEMLAIVRSVAVPPDVEAGMGHAFDLGVDWERARVQKILQLWMDDRPGMQDLDGIFKDVSNGVQYP